MAPPIRAKLSINYVWLKEFIKLFFNKIAPPDSNASF